MVSCPRWIYYIITIKAPAVNVLSHQIRLQNITDATTEDYGTGNFSNNGITSYSEINHTMTVSADKVFEVQHICGQTTLNIGLGRGTGFGTNEVYTSVTISKS